MPELMAWLATGTEVIGAVLLVIGFAVRWISIPLTVTMVVAAVVAHWENGWQAVVNSNFPFASEHLGMFRFEDAGGALERLSRAQEYSRTTETMTGSPVRASSSSSTTA